MLFNEGSPTLPGAISATPLPPLFNEHFPTLPSAISATPLPPLLSHLYSVSSPLCTMPSDQFVHAPQPGVHYTVSTDFNSSWTNMSDELIYELGYGICEDKQCYALSTDTNQILSTPEQLDRHLTSCLDIYE